MQNQVLRFFHSGVSCWSSSLNKSQLSKLRKKTGFTFSNCRKALEVNDNNIEKAEKWLQEQAQALGWTKLSKLEGRVTAQGMVGIAIDGKNAAMIEVNCETDFVARNKNFREIINLVSSSCLHHAKLNKNKTGPISKEFLDTEQMKSLQAADGKQLADHVALLVSSVGENVSLRRAVCIGVPDNLHLAGYAHPGASEEQTVMSGKYGALLMYSALKSNVATQHTCRQLCQHVVGMNPKTIEKEETDANNNETEEAARKGAAAAAQKKVENQQNPEGDQDTEYTNDNDIDNNEETAMLSQDFLLDATVTVKQVTSEAGITIHDFIRFETGEKLQEEVKDPEPRVQQMTG